MLMLRLKTATQRQHDAAEALMPVLRGGLSRREYAQMLRQLAAVIEPLETQLQVAGLPPEFEMYRRLKAPLLRRDLAALPPTQPATPRPLRLRGVPEALGALYVLEGATLGGQVISRHLRAELGLHPASGGGYFYGYGPETGAMWRAFGQAMNAWTGEESRSGATPAEDRVIMGARQTFGAFEHSLREGAQRVWGETAGLVARGAEA